MSYTEHPVLDLVFTSGGAIGQYGPVKFSGDNVVACASAGEGIIGVAQEAAGASGRALKVRVLGVSLLLAGGVIGKGAYVGAGSGGKAAAISSAGDCAIGVALDAAGSDGDVIRALVTGPWTYYVGT
ncbi:MAG TPA: DUF2190 family protein [Candidatus Brocadiia bacterium]|nr:DUF2190 family protein [Candidatus Brocadiia bacterium]